MAIRDLGGTGGQSQNVGHGVSSAAPATDPALCSEWSGTALTTLSDPGSAPSPYKAQTGSPVPAFASTFTAYSGRKLTMVRCAIDGSAMLASNQQVLGNGNWSTTGTLFNNSVTRMGAAIDAIEAAGDTLGDVFVIWSQGYRDAVGGNNLDQYGAAQAALVSRWRTALGLPDLQLFIEKMYAPGVANPPTAANCLYIRDQEIAAVAATDGLHFGFTEGDTFAERGWLNSDNLHYNQVGLNYMGYKFALAAKDHYGYADPVDPPEPPAAPASLTSVLGHRLLIGPGLSPLPREWMSPGTYSWTCPFGVTSITVEAWGAGGGGRGGVAGGRGGQGGGSGEYHIITIAVTPGVTYTVTIGAGGNGSTYNTNDGTSGADVTFAQGATILLRAKAGLKPTDANTPGAGGSGGTGGTGTNGATGGTSTNTSGSDGAAGGNAPGSGGLGGAGGITGNIAGKVGAAPGGGGGGGKGNAAGANGGNGASGGLRITAA